MDFFKTLLNGLLTIKPDWNAKVGEFGHIENQPFYEQEVTIYGVMAQGILEKIADNKYKVEFIPEGKNTIEPSEARNILENADSVIYIPSSPRERWRVDNDEYILDKSSIEKTDDGLNMYSVDRSLMVQIYNDEGESVQYFTFFNSVDYNDKNIKIVIGPESYLATKALDSKFLPEGVGGVSISGSDGIQVSTSDDGEVEIGIAHDFLISRPAITSGTEDLTPEESSLATGTLYFRYE